jgi:hypothetical protein
LSFLYLWKVAIADYTPFYQKFDLLFNEKERCSTTEYLAILKYHEAMMQAIRKAL